MYLGFFDWFDGLGEFTENYKASRVPWNLLGWVLNHAIGPYWTQIALATASLSAVALLLFLIGRLMLSRWAALAVGIGFAYWPYLQSGGNDGQWLYHNTLLGPALLFGCWTLLWTVRQTRTHRVVAGGALAAMSALVAGLLNAYSVLLLFALAVVLLILHCTNGANRASVRRFAPAWVLGAIAGFTGLFAAFGAVSALMSDRGFWFHKPMWSFIREQSSSENKAALWEPLSSGWLWRAHYLAPVLLAVAFAGVAALYAYRRRPDQPLTQEGVAAWAVLIGAFINCTLFVGLYTLGFESLDNVKLAFPLTMSTPLLILGGLAVLRTTVGPPATRNDRAGRSDLALVGVALVLPVAALAAGLASSLPYLSMASPTQAQAITMAALCVSLSLAVFAARHLRPSLSQLAVPIAVFALFLPATWAVAGELRWVSPGPKPIMGHLPPDLTLALRAELLEEGGPGALPNPRTPTIWADPANRHRSTEGAPHVEKIVSRVLNSFHQLAETPGLVEGGEWLPFDQVDDRVIRRAIGDGSLVLVSDNRRRLEQLIRRARDLDPTCSFLITRTQGASDTLWVARVSS